MAEALEEEDDEAAAAAPLPFSFPLPATTLTSEMLTTVLLIDDPSKLVTTTGEFVIGDTLELMSEIGTVVTALPETGTAVIGALVATVCGNYIARKQEKEQQVRWMNS